MESKTPEPLTADQRKDLAEKIQKTADKLQRIATAYQRCCDLAGGDLPQRSDAFLILVESAGRLTSMHLSELGALLDCLESVRDRDQPLNVEPDWLWYPFFKSPGYGG